MNDVEGCYAVEVNAFPHHYCSASIGIDLNSVWNETLTDPAPDVSPAVVEGNGEARLICEEDSGPLLPCPVQTAPTQRCTGAAVSWSQGNSDCCAP